MEDLFICYDVGYNWKPIDIMNVSLKPIIINQLNYIILLFTLRDT